MTTQGAIQTSDEYDKRGNLIAVEENEAIQQEYIYDIANMLTKAVLYENGQIASTAE